MLAIARMLEVNIVTHAGHKERFAIHGRRGVASAASQRCCIIWTRLHSGTLLDSSTFRGGPSLYYTHGGRPVITSQWPAGGPDGFLGKYRPGGRPDIGGSIGMESACVGV